MISVIIPVYNEENNIKLTIEKVKENDTKNYIKEIVVVDGGSTDNSVNIATNEGVRVLLSSTKGRAAQMNYGALNATGNLLYFLHADTLPPAGFTSDIIFASKAGFSAGCFKLSFNHHHWFLRANAWFTRFNIDSFRFGDQSLFVTKEKFFSIGCFSESHLLLEDQHFIKRIKRAGTFTIINKPVITSARKYIENGIYKTQALFFLIYLMYRLGFSQQTLVNTYRKFIRQDKL